MTPAKRPHRKAGAPGKQPPLILVVDDYADNREMYATFLTFAGLRVAEAENGGEALARAFELRPNLIVMDLSLPGVDGWEATRQLKKDARTRDIPIVAVTGHALDGAAQGARDAGCDAFLKKPCLPKDLLTEIRRVLATRRGTPVAKTRG